MLNHPPAGGRPQRAAGWAAAAELPLVLLAAPAFVFPTPARLAAALLILVPLWGALAYSTRRLVPRSPQNPALLLLAACLAVSAAVTPSLATSLGKVAGTLYGLLLFWAVARWATTASRLRALGWAYGGGGVLLACAGLMFAHVLAKFSPLAALTLHLPAVVRGTPSSVSGVSANGVAGMLIMVLPAQVVCLWAGIQEARQPAPGPRWRRLALVVAAAGGAALTAGTIVVMQSRGAWASLALAVSAAAILAMRPRRRVIAASLVIVALGAGAVAAARSAVWQSPQWAAVERSLADRLDLWRGAVDALRDVPFTGMGMNVFRSLYSVRYSTAASGEGADIAHAHNQLLQTGLDLGLVGLFAYLAVWYGAARQIRALWRGPRATLRHLAGALAVGLLAHFLFGLTDAVPLGSKVGVFFWLAVAVLNAAHGLAADQPRG